MTREELRREIGYTKIIAERDAIILELWDKMDMLMEQNSTLKAEKEAKQDAKKDGDKEELNHG